ncbi:MAG: hypothetical protein ACLFOY_00435 [Desulfatibacillaceae bacterium]
MVKPTVTILLAAILALVTLPCSVSADAGENGEPGLLQRLPGRYGGHLKIRGSVAWPGGDSHYSLVGAEAMVDGAAEFRLKAEYEATDDISFTAHYENIFSAGDTRRRNKALNRRFPALSATGVTTSAQPDDDRRLFDLTATLDDAPGHVWYHRMDRLYAAYTTFTLDVRAGRQAVTWGNGLVFNPMDLFNPFAPTDVERDYKNGDDMLSVQYSPSRGNVHLLYVPRRNPADGNPSRDHSSLAAKYHVMSGDHELDFMVGRHYRDMVAGFGVTGYLGAAAWRMDVVGVLLEPDDGRRLPIDDKGSYVSAVANIDYSWVWAGKNWYGLLEVYHNGLMDNEYAEDSATRAVRERLDRGQLHTLGNTYAAGTVRFEAHPLVNLHLAAITNLADPSGILQPRMVYDVRQNTRIVAGANVYWGRDGSEFGGYSIPGTNLYASPADNVYVWATRYF